MKTIFKKLKQKTKTKNENAKQTHRKVSRCTNKDKLKLKL